MIAGHLEIQLSADLARLNRDMASARRVVSDTTAQMERAANAARAALGGIVAGLGGRELMQMADEYTKYTAQIKLATQSEREYAQARAEVKRIATASQQDLAATGTLYARIANGTAELGVAQKDVARITETVNMALKVSGATAAESASAQLQLSQAFASGTLRGEEFNAVNEAAPRLMKALADGIGVPVGALKEMASEGKITSGIMADVLPRALEDLQQEAKQVQTIGGAFTVLKNNAMEFVGVQAQASGVVSTLTGGIGLLANNFQTLAGAILTVTAAKVGSWAASFVQDMHRQIVSSRELQAATLARAVTTTEAAAMAANAKLAEAQADVRTTAASLGLANARVAELRAAVLAADGAVALAIATNGLIPAQARAAALAEAHGIALSTQAVAAAGATTATVASTAAIGAQAAAATLGARAVAGLRAAMGFLGGPIGAVVTLLGIGAMAWSHWGNSAKDANNMAAQAVEETHEEMLRRIQKQNEKLRERIALANAKPNLKVENAAELDRLASLWAEYNHAKNGTGPYANKDAQYRSVFEGIALREYNELLKDVNENQRLRTAEAQKGVDTRVAAFMKENATKKEQMEAELKAIADLKGKTSEYDEMVRRIRAKYADNGAAKALAQEATAYQNLITSIGEKNAANVLELQGYNKLSDSQKYTIQLDAEIKSGKTKLSAESIRKARADIEQLAAQEKLIDAQERARKVEEATQKAVEESIGRDAETLLQLQERARGLEREIELHGKTAEAAIMAEAAKVRASAEAGVWAEEYRQKLIQQAEELERIAKLQGRKDALEASSKAAQDASEDQKRLWTDIERTAHDTFVSIQDGSAAMWTRMKNTAKNVFFDWLYQMTVKKWVINVGTSLGLTGGTAGLAQAADGATGGGNPLGIAQSAKAAYEAITSGFAGLSDAVAGGVQSMMSSMGYYPSAANGLATASGQALTPFASGVGTAAGYLGGAAIGVYGGRAISNGYGMFGGSGNTAVNVGTIAGAIIGGPIGAAIGGMIGGLANRAFGHKAKEYGDSTLNGTFGASGFTGSTDTAWKQEGGWFRSDKQGVDKVAIDAAMSKELGAAYDAIKAASADYATVLGINAGAIKDRAQSLSIALTKDEEANKKAIADFFVGVANTVAGELLPSLSTFQQEGEAASATLQRLAGNYAMIDIALTSIGMAFGAVGVSSLEARERLVVAAGGIEAFASNAAGFAQNFLTEAERNAPVLKAVTEQLAAMGLSSVDTRDEFKQVVQGLDLTTEAGARQYGELMKMQAAFAQLYPAIEATTTAADNGASVMQERANLQNELDQLTMSSAQLLAKQRDALDESNRALFDQVQAIKAQAQASQAAKDRGANLLAGVDSMFSALQSVVGRERTLLQESANAHRALSQALRGTLDSMSAAGQGLEDRQGARAQIQAALAIAKAGGVLPDADSLKGALSVLSKDASSMFATQQDYLRDFYSTQNDIAALAGLTDDALSVEEKSLKALDGILESAQQQINALKGLDTSTLTLVEVMRGFSVAIGAAKADPVASAGGSIASMYQELLGRPADSAGLDYWQNAVAGGMSLNQVRQFILQGDEYKKLQKVPGFAYGGDHTGGLRWVGELGPEIEATGPSRIHSTSDLVASLRNPVDNSAALAGEIRALRTEVQGLRAEARATASHTEKSTRLLDRIERHAELQADVLDRNSGGGGPFMVTFEGVPQLVRVVE